MKINFLEKVISIISPKTAFTREVQRQKIKAITDNEIVDSSSFQESTLRRFNPPLDKPKTYMNRSVLNITSARIQKLYWSGTTAKIIIDGIVSNVVGEGIKVKSVPDHETLGLTRDEARKLGERITKNFSSWCLSNESDLMGEDSFFQQTITAYTTYHIFGEFFFRITVENTKYGDIPKLYLVSPDRVKNPTSTNEKLNINSKEKKVINGIEFDQNNKATHYHICLDDNPNSFLSETQRFGIYGEESKERVIFHFLERKIIEQIRGISPLAACLASIVNLEKYKKAERTAAVQQGNLTFTIKTDEELEEDEDFFDDEESKKLKKSGVMEKNSTKIKEATFVEIKGNEEVKMLQPSRPNAQYKPYLMAEWQEIAASIEVPFEVLLMFFSASYSASRGAVTLSDRSFDLKRNKFGNGFIFPFYQALFEIDLEGGLYPEIDKELYFDNLTYRSAVLGVEYSSLRRKDIDGLKSAKAAGERILRKITSIGHEQREAGLDPDLMKAEIKEEEKFYCKEVQQNV